jgi:electron transport protein HydN
MSEHQSVFVLADPGKCTGCRACEIACFAGHLAKKPKTIGNFTSPVTPRLYLAKAEGKCMPIQCHHCEEAPCVKSCLPGACAKDADGVVSIDERKCIGRRNCAMACPFGAIQVYTSEELGETGKATPKIVFKCDTCKDDLEGPQCIKTCPNEALKLMKTEEVLVDKRVAAINALGTFGTTAAQATGQAQ